MMPIVILIVSLLLDGLLTNYLPYLIDDLSYFTPLFTVISVFIIYPFYRKSEKKYYIVAFITGFVYDLFYTDLLFFNAVVFIIIALLSKFIQKNFELSFFKILLYTIIIVASYEVLTALIFFIYHVVPITIPKVIYKIEHTLIINIIYLEIVYLIIKLVPKRFKKISIN